MDDGMVVEDNIIMMPDIDYVPNPDGLGCELFSCMKRNKDILAQIEAKTGKRDTYDELLRRCIRTAISLKKFNITSDDIICICTYNQLDACVPYIAGLFIGAKLCALDPSLSRNDSAYLLEQVQPKIIFVVSEKQDMYEDILRGLSDETKLVTFGYEGENCFGKFLCEHPEEEDFLPEKAKSVFDTAVIMFSSGTTGLAKGICLNHFSLLSQAKNFILCDFDADVVLGYASLYWISAVFVLIQSVLNKTARILCRAFDPANTLSIISKYKATFMFIAPNQAIAVLKEGDAKHCDVASLKDVLIGGAPLSAENLLAVRGLFSEACVFSAYGLTEVAGPGLVFRKRLQNYFALLDSKPKSCGKPIPGIWYKVVDLETDQVLGSNMIGELRLKTKFQTNGYYGRDSSDAWDASGWLRTGDVCYYDDDYCFYIVDRIKEMMKFQSWHVAPALLEGILQEHDAVKAAVVFGVPHEEDGEHPIGVVIRSDEAGDIDAQILVEYVNSRVDDRQKLRAGIVFIDEIPYTPTGKIKRKWLKEKILEMLKNRE